MEGLLQAGRVGAGGVVVGGVWFDASTVGLAGVLVCSGASRQYESHRS